MNEKLRVEPSFQRVGQDLYAELMAMNGTPVSFEELTPKPDNFEGDVIEESLVEEEIEDAGIDEVEQSVDSSEEDSESNVE